MKVTLTAKIPNKAKPRSASTSRTRPAGVCAVTMSLSLLHMRYSVLDTELPRSRVSARPPVETRRVQRAGTQPSAGGGPDVGPRDQLPARTPAEHRPGPHR